jgi:hypothetical protein
MRRARTLTASGLLGLVLLLGLGFLESTGAQQGPRLTIGLSAEPSTLDPQAADIFAAYYGVTERGNFEGKNILHRVRDTDVLAEMHGFGNAMLSTLVGVCSEEYPAASIACECGEEAQYQRKRSGQCKTLLGAIELKRAYYLCSHCHRGCCPLDQQLGFCAGSISAGLDELLALLGCQFSFAHSAQMVKHLTLVTVSPNRCRRSTEALGRLVAEEEESIRHHVWEQATLRLPSVSPEVIDPLYISADGVTVRELKHDADVALVRRHVRGQRAVDPHLAGVGLNQAGDEEQHRGLARTRRAEEGDELAFSQLEVGAGEGRHGPVALAQTQDSELVGRCRHIDVGLSRLDSPSTPRSTG